MTDNTFDDIRPYTDEEIPAAMQRIADSTALPLLASYVCPEKPLDEVRQMLCSFKTVNDFQYGIMYRVNKQIAAKSISQLTHGGEENLRKDTPYLFVSNGSQTFACRLDPEHESWEYLTGIPAWNEIQL